MERPREEWEKRIREAFATYEDVQRVAERVRRETAERIIAEVLSAHASSHLAAYEKFGESNLASILFMDIVGYSKLKRDDDQREAIELLNRLVVDALSRTGCRLDDVVCLPTGDGMCLCFSSITDGPLMVAEEVQVTLAEENKRRKRRKLQAQGSG
jgi:class 3 adenylate cyclase